MTSEVAILTGGLEVIDQLAPEWRALCDEGRSDAPYVRPEWIAAGVRAFMPHGQLAVLTVRDGGRLRALLPLVAERRLRCAVPVATLRSPTTFHSGRFGLVLGTDVDGCAAVRAIWRTLRRSTNWDAIELQHVDAESALPMLAAVAREDRCSAAVQVGHRVPYIPLTQGASLDQTLSATKARFRSHLRARMRRLEQRGAVRLVRCDRFDRAALDRFYQLERAGWKGQEGSAIVCDASTRQFYDDAARAADIGGYLSLYLLQCGEETVAAHFGLTCRGRYYAHKVAYNEAFSTYGPGQLIIHAILGDAIERGLVEFDFIGPWAPWKAEWAPDARQHVSLHVFNRTIVGRTTHAAMFPLRAHARHLKWTVLARLGHTAQS